MALRRVVPVACLTLVALAIGCSAQEDDGLNPQPLPPQDERAPNGGGSTSSGGPNIGSAACSGTCCSKPKEGSACDASTDTSCSWAVTCPTGLVLPYEVTCTNGAWQLTNGCPAEGQIDERGCPATQPADASPCDANVVTSSCGYVLECDGYRKSMIATCATQNSQGTVWTSPPLGTCD